MKASALPFPPHRASPLCSLIFGFVASWKSCEAIVGADEKAWHLLIKRLAGRLLARLPETFMEGWSGWEGRGLASVMLSFERDKDFSHFPRALMQKIIKLLYNFCLFRI